MFGALFVPLLALTLLLMNTRRGWVGERFRSGSVTNAALRVPAGNASNASRIRRTEQ